MKISHEVRFFLALLSSLPAICVGQEANSKEASGLDSLLKVKIQGTAQQTNTASKYYQTTSEAASSITIITAEEIERYGCESIAEVLNHVRSFFVTYDRMYSNVGVRGFSRLGDYNNRLLLLINGHRVNENVYSSALMGSESALDMNSIERIEVIRGPGSSLYGSNALFGVINVITKDIKQLNGYSMYAEAGSYGAKETGVQFGKKIKKDANIFVSANWLDADGQTFFFPEYQAPSTNLGIAKNLDWENYYNLHGKVYYKNLFVQGMFSSREKAYPTAAYTTAFNDGAAKVLDERGFFDLGYEKSLSSKLWAKAKAYYDYYRFAGWYPEEEDYIYFDRSIGKWYGFEGQLLYDLNSVNRLSFGLEYQNSARADYKCWDASATFDYINHPFTMFSAYLEDEYVAARQIKFVLGSRLDHFSTSGSALSPRGAIVYMPFKNSTIKLLYGHAFREPNLYEAYYENSASYSISNPNLKAEGIDTKEIVWEQKINRTISGFLVFYQYKMKNLIDQVESENPLDPESSYKQFRNVDEVSANGVEIELNGKLGERVHFYASHSIQAAENKVSGKRLVNSPTHLFKGGFSAPLKNLLYFSCMTTYESKRQTLYDFDTKPAWIADVNIATAPLFSFITLSFRIKNIFDQPYEYPAGYDHAPIETIPQNRRNYSFKISAKF
jgi:outer membrane receptor for ferrienterochelin and colicins